MAKVYLDSAATSLWRPTCVAEAVARSVMIHAGYGRNRSAPSDAAAGEIFAAREAAARLFGARDASCIVFCLNATHALNTAIFGLYRPGRPCLISAYEHNAVRRPIAELERRGETELAVAESPLFDREGAYAAFAREIENKKPGLVVCTSVGNVFGNIMPIARIGELCKKSGAAFVVDASQGAGILPLDMEKIGADAMCMPGHKGLLGPAGTGIMVLGSSCPRPFLFGGTGIASEEAGMPEAPPERYEGGTLNVCGICGLGEALRYLELHGDAIHRKKQALCRAFAETLAGAGYRVFGPEENGATGLFSFDPGFDSEVAAELLADAGITVRGGLHCAPLAHRAAGTFDRGTVRISPQPNLGMRTAKKAAENIVRVLDKAR